MTDAGGSGPITIPVISGDPDSCRQTAQYLTRLAGIAFDVEGGFRGAGRSSEGFWQGAAADAFRSYMGNWATNAQSLEDSAKRLAAALDRFAGDIQTAQSRLAQALDAARQVGLHVTDKEIYPPDIPAGKAGLEEPRFEKQRQVFQEVSGTLSELGGHQVPAAHNRLLSALKPVANWLSTRANDELLISKTIAAGSAIADTTERLKREAIADQAKADAAKSLLDDPTLSQAERNTALKELIKYNIQTKSDTEVAKDFDRLLSWLPGKAVTALRASMADMLHVNGVRFLGPFLKSFPAIGQIVGAGFTAYETTVKHADPVKSWEDYGLSSLAIAGGWQLADLGGIAAIDAGLLAAPGAGWVIAGGLTLSVAASIGTGWLVNKYGDTVNHAIASAAGTVAHDTTAAAGWTKNHAEALANTAKHDTTAATDWTKQHAESLANTAKHDTTAATDWTKQHAESLANTAEHDASEAKNWTEHKLSSADDWLKRHF